MKNMCFGSNCSDIHVRQSEGATPPGSGNDRH
jgi:hypothetical protein